jgi:hypothetical protein
MSISLLQTFSDRALRRRRRRLYDRQRQAAPTVALTVKTFSLAQRTEIAAHIQKYINYDIYIKRASQHVCPEPGIVGAAPTSRYFQRVITADIDIRSAAHAKDALPASKDDALRLLAESGLPEPTLVVHTGNGLMPMWVSARAAVGLLRSADSDRRRSATAPYRSALRLDAG